MSTLIIIGAIVIIAFFIWCICTLAPFYKDEGWNFFNVGTIASFVMLIAIVILTAAHFIGCWQWLTPNVMSTVFLCALVWLGAYFVAIAFSMRDKKQ